MGAIVGKNFRRGLWVTAEDFEVEYPDEGESTIVVTYTPNTALGLTDERNRVAVIDFHEGKVLEYEDRYPTFYYWVLFCVVAGLLGSYTAVMLWARRLHLRAQESGRELEDLERKRRLQSIRRLRNAGVPD
jgi:hypothetical protein